MKLVELHIKPTRYAANVIGGLLFGVGFALIGYCPGTASRSRARKHDAIAGVLGLLAGSYLYAEYSAQLGKTVETWASAENSHCLRYFMCPQPHSYSCSRRC